MSDTKQMGGKTCIPMHFKLNLKFKMVVNLLYTGFVQDFYTLGFVYALASAKQGTFYTALEIKLNYISYKLVETFIQFLSSALLYLNH